MAVEITCVQKGSIAEKKKISAGDRLVSINGNAIADVLDYRFYLNDSKLTVEVETSSGKNKKIKIRKDEFEDIGLEFETYLMDRQHSCKNKCIFCFVDQLPPDLRESLYFKDDDSRLSFLFGNYITLTNMSEEEIDRIIKMHISPVNISVHTMNPQLRVEMMKNPNSGACLRYIKKLADAGITINTQLVLCPGINDGAELDFSLKELSALFPSVQSIAAVPVGITCHREGLYPLRCYTKEEASAVIDTIDKFNKGFGHTIAYASDEFFIQAGREIPEEEYYGDYPQLDNGVGLWSLLKSEFVFSLENDSLCSPQKMHRVKCVTGDAAFPLISELASMAQSSFDNLEIEVLKAHSSLFGENVTVAGLLCGADILNALKNTSGADKVIIPEVALRHEGDMFLDDMTLVELEKQAGVRIVPVPNDGAVLLSEMLSE